MTTATLRDLLTAALAVNTSAPSNRLALTIPGPRLPGGYYAGEDDQGRPVTGYSRRQARRLLDALDAAEAGE